MFRFTSSTQAGQPAPLRYRPEDEFKLVAILNKLQVHIVARRYLSDEPYPAQKTLEMLIYSSQGVGMNLTTLANACTLAENYFDGKTHRGYYSVYFATPLLWDIDKILELRLFFGLLKQLRVSLTLHTPQFMQMLPTQRRALITALSPVMPLCTMRFANPWYYDTRGMQCSHFKEIEWLRDTYFPQTLLEPVSCNHEPDVLSSLINIDARRVEPPQESLAKRILGF